MTTPAVDMFAQRQAERLVDLPSKFARFASEHPDAVALRWSGQPWSFATLAARAGRYAALLSERVRPGGWVAWCASRSPEVVAMILGAFAAGRAVVPVEPEHPVSRLRLTLEDAGPALLVTDHTAARELTLGYEADKALLDELAAEAVLYDAGALPSPDLTDVAYVIYTSGSTGGPKGVMVQHRQLAQLGHAVDTSEPVVGAGNTVLSVASLAFDMMVIDIFVALANGATVVLPPGGNRQREPMSLLAAIETHGVDTVYATPSLLQMLVLAGLGTEGRRRVRVITGGEAMSRGLAAALLARCSSVYQGYGPTETTVLCSYHRVVHPGYLPLGKPSPGTSFYPVDEHLTVVPLNVRAELGIGGSMVAAGYHNRARLTAERFRPDPYADVAGSRCYLSGDLVRVDNAGGAIFAGRQDTQVKIRGHRVELGEVEAAVLRQPGVRQCVAATGEDAAGNTELIAYVVGEDDPAALRAKLLDVLPASMVPTRFLVVDTIPLTANGKPDRQALGKVDAPATPAEEDAPATELETRISHLWGEVLGAASVGVNEGFFDLGGHSLLAMEIVARIRADFGVDLPVWELFSVPTVRAWAAALEEAMRAGSDTDSDVKSAPVTFAQAALCIAEQVVPGVTSPGFVVGVAVEGDLDVGELLAALDKVMARHDMLRTRFELRGVDSVQIVEPFAELDFDEAVCRDGAGTAATLRRWAQRPFDLSTGPLFRALLVEEAGAARTLHLCFHDAICDAASARIVGSDIAAAYGAAGQSGEAAGRLAFAGLARAQRGQGAGAAAAELVGQWRARLPKVPTGSGGTTDYRTLTRQMVLSAAQNARLHEQAAHHGVDIAAILLDRLRAATGARVGGLLLSGRGEGVEAMVGPLAATLLVPFTGTGVDALRADIAWALEHAVPAEMLGLQLQGGERILAVPQVAVAVRAPDAPVTSTDQRLVLRPRYTGWPDGPSPARTGVALSVEIADQPDGECPMLVQYRPDALDEAVLAGLLDG